MDKNIRKEFCYLPVCGKKIFSIVLSFFLTKRKCMLNQQDWRLIDNSICYITVLLEFPRSAKLQANMNIVFL